jgi:hypothetical protein
MLDTFLIGYSMTVPVWNSECTFIPLTTKLQLTSIDEQSTWSDGLKLNTNFRQSREWKITHYFYRYRQIISNKKLIQHIM